MSERLADSAISHVTTKDELLGSLEYLECIIIESVYHANLGRLRRSWVTCRRAVNTAQLMGLNRSDHRVQYTVLDTQTRYCPQTIWFRIMFLDRFLSLLLGLPQACLDHNATFDAAPGMEQLEREHCLVASRILERNGPEFSSHDYNLTQALDLELQRASRSLPSKWWLLPSLDINLGNSQDLIQNTRRMFAQVLHYNLLNQLHLPYMLLSTSAERRYDYSRITCVNASREILVRFIALRNFNKIGSSCRIVDFIALMAAITLSLAHLDSEALKVENMLAHQYQSDRAMIEEVEENMRAVNQLNSDALSAQSAELLRQLLAIDVAPSDESLPTATRVSLFGVANEIVPTPVDQDADNAVNIEIPYFGFIRIGHSSARVDGLQIYPTTGLLSQSQPLDSSTANVQIPHNNLPGLPFGFATFDANLDADNTTQIHTNDKDSDEIGLNADASIRNPPRPGVLASGMSDMNAQLELQLRDDVFDPVLQHSYPGLAARREDWAFQSVDLAFIDSLISGTVDEVM